MTAIGDTIIDQAYGIGWSVVRRLPERSAYALFERIADINWARHGKQVRRLEANLRRVVGPDVSEKELRHLSHLGMRSYLRYFCDSFRMPGWSQKRIVGDFVAYDEHLLSDSLALEKGVVCALPHMGNWDHAGAWATLAHRQIVTVAERLKPEDVYEQFLEYRRGLGMEVLPLTGGDPPFPILARRLRAGGLICLLADRDLTTHGIPVDFFGAEARFPAGPAALAIVTGATLLACTLWHENGKNHLRFHRIEIPTDGDRTTRIQVSTQRVADAFAEGISGHPSDWHMLARLWTDDLDPTAVRSS